VAIEGSASAEIEAPIERVYAVAADIEHLPRWQPEVKRATVLERDRDGDQVLVRTETETTVRTLQSDLRFDYDDEPSGLRWRQERGDVKSLDGSWSFEDLGDGRTRATYRIRVDLGRMLGMVVRGPVVDALRRHMIDSMPAKLKDEVEGG
jgi:ribosome-associated toxin RatA of RatAB toxin-antitoxin module